MALQQQMPQQIPQYMPTTTTTPIPIPTGASGSAQPVVYVQQPLQGAQSLPVYGQQPQLAGYPSPSYKSGYSHSYGIPSPAQYAPSPYGGPYNFSQDGSFTPRRHHHQHRHHCGHHNRHGHHGFSHRRHRTYSDPEYDNRHWRC